MFSNFIGVNDKAACSSENTGNAAREFFLEGRRNEERCGERSFVTEFSFVAPKVLHWNHRWNKCACRNFSRDADLYSVSSIDRFAGLSLLYTATVCCFFFQSTLEFEQFGQACSAQSKK